MTTRKMICPETKTPDCIDCVHSGLHEKDDKCVSDSGCPKCVMVQVIK